MYFSFFKLKKWGKKTAETRRRNCAVLPYRFSDFPPHWYWCGGKLFYGNGNPTSRSFLRGHAAVPPEEVVGWPGVLPESSGFWPGVCPLKPPVGGVPLGR